MAALDVKHYVDSIVVLFLSHFTVHPVLIHQSFLFIFIITIIVVKRLPDGSKYSGITHIVSRIVELVTFNQCMEMSIVLTLIHLLKKTCCQTVACHRGEHSFHFRSIIKVDYPFKHLRNSSPQIYYSIIIYSRLCGLFLNPKCVFRVPEVNILAEKNPINTSESA